MKIRAISHGCFSVILIGALMGCSSTHREARKPSVAVLISAKVGDRPSPAEIAEIHKMLQPEIERRGYVMAKSSRSADYFVSVRYPVDPLSIGRVTFEKKEGSSQTMVTADEIAFDQSTNALTCVGESTVSWGGRVLKAKNVTIDFGEGTVRVFVARSDGKLLTGNQQAFDSMSTGAQFTPLFSDRLPKTDLHLKSRTTR